MDKNNKFPKKIKKTPLHELIKSNNYLNQYCNFLQMECNKNEMNINSIYHRQLFLEKEMQEIKFLLEFLSIKMGIDVESMNEAKKRMQNIKNEHRKIFALHDDLTEKCPHCGAISSKENIKCPKCGEKKEKRII